jgi:hypothetical protein
LQQVRSLFSADRCEATLTEPLRNSIVPAALSSVEPRARGRPLACAELFSFISLRHRRRNRSNAIAAVIVPPAVAAITLGLIKQQGCAHQLDRTKAFNHAGNVTAAMLAGFFGNLFGLMPSLP